MFWSFGFSFWDLFGIWCLRSVGSRLGHTTDEDGVLRQLLVTFYAEGLIAVAVDDGLRGPDG